MEIHSHSTRSSRRRRAWILAGAAAFLLIAAAILSGCVSITDVQLNGNVPASADYQISLTLTATTNAEDAVRGVFALRIPSAWEVKSVTFVGTLNGQATRSTVMEGIYATDWETAAGVGHNGHKDGYKWWVGYSTAQTGVVGDSSRVDVLIDTHGRGGTYAVDFATGVAGKDDPEDLADKTLWQIGSAGPLPSGVLLDQAVTLYCFSDVTPDTSHFEAIQGMGAKGLIEGYPTGSGGYNEFRPTKVVFRAQYAKMIDGALGLVVDETMAAPVDFSDLGADITNDPYPHEYVWTAYNNNIIKGYDDGTFKPYSPISRGHVITMTVRALLKLHPDALRPVPASFVQTWGNDLLPEHKANARIAEYNGLLAGLPLTTTAAGGNASMPRGEVAQVLWNMMGLISR